MDDWGIQGRRPRHSTETVEKVKDTKKWAPDWNCNACSYLNFGSSGRVNCLMCDTSKVSHVERVGVGTIFVGGIFTGYFDPCVIERVEEWNLHKSAVSATISQLFLSFGQITGFTLVPPKAGKSHSVAFIEFASWESCYPAISQYNKVFLRKRGALLQDSFLVVSHTENARCNKTSKAELLLLEKGVSYEGKSATKSSLTYVLPATIEMVFTLLETRGGGPMSMTQLLTLLPPGKSLKKIQGEILLSSKLTCYSLPVSSGLASGQVFLCLKPEQTSSDTLAQSPLGNLDESMLRLQIIENLLQTLDGELAVSEIFLRCCGMLPTDETQLAILDLCPEIELMLSNNTFIYKLKGDLIKCCIKGNLN